MSEPSVAGEPLVGFRRHLRAEIVTGEATYLFSEHGVTALEASALEALTPLLDGTRDAATLLREAPAGMPPAQVDALVRQLTDAGLVTTRSVTAADLAPGAVAYWESAGLDSDRALDALDVATIAFEAIGDIDDTVVRAACVAAGLNVLDPAHAPTADLTVVLCDDYLDPALDPIDRAHRTANRPWLLAKPLGTQPWIGPIFRPGDACWHCLSHRLWIHRQAEAHVQSALGRTGPAPRPAAVISPVGGLAGHLIALEAAKWLAGYRYPGQRAVWTLDTLGIGGRHHDLRARPQCVSCGDPTLFARAAERAVVPISRPKASFAGGGHRSMPPERVLEHYRHLISPVTGVVREVRRDHRGPAFLNSFRAGANLAVGARGLDELRGGLRSEHGGKGVTATHAEVSALCEALERHSGSFHGDETRIRGSLHSLGPEAVHPNAVQLYHDRQFADRTVWNADNSSFQHVSERLDERAVIDWTPVWSLTTGRRRLLPTGLLYYGTPVSPHQRFVRADSNGNAAGSSLEDALLQGFFELVERDAVALWWYNRTRMPAIDLDTSADPWIAELREVHRGLGREVWVLDLTADLAVPTMVALSRRTNAVAEDIVFGFGAHFDPQVALRRALTELNQLLPAVVEVDQHGRGYGCDDPDAMRWWRCATVANQPYLLPSSAARSRTLADFDYVANGDLLDDVRLAEDIVTRHGMDLLVLDQTRPDVGLPVVKVIVPGLRHFWARFGPGRLYDVPVHLGRLDRPTSYEELNPVPIFV